MTEQDRLYYRGRMATEQAAAARAAHPLAAQSHRRLAAEYASLIAANDPAGDDHAAGEATGRRDSAA